MKLEFERIRINNFLSLGTGIEVSLEDQGFVLVKGENQISAKSSSNGSGKSSIFDAIFWTLTGETLRGASKVINDYAKEDCKCEVDFRVNNNSYTVIRSVSLQKNKESCYVYCNKELLTDQVKKSQDTIYKIIPTLSVEILGSVILLGQGIPHKFSSLSPIARKGLLETISGTSGKVDELKEKVDSLEQSTLQVIGSMQRTQMEYELQVSNYNSQISQLKEDLLRTTSVDSQDSIRKLSEEIKNCKEKEAELSQEIPKTEEAYRVANQTFENVRNYLSQSEFKLNDLRSKTLSSNNGICPTCKRPYENYEEIQQVLKSYKEAYEEESRTHKVLLEKYNSVKSLGESLQTRVQRMTSERSVVLSKIPVYEEQIRVLKDQLVTRNDEISQRISDLESKINELSLKYYDIGKELEELLTKKKAIEALKRILARDFKGYLLEDEIQFLSNQANKYGTYLFDRDSKIEIILKQNKVLIQISNRSYENLSGGERQKVDLCVQFALRDMLAVISGLSCNLLVLDEIFDNLDYIGSENLVTLITSEFSDTNSIFTITHHSDISIPYDKILTVTKTLQGVSEIQEME